MATLAEPDPKQTGDQNYRVPHGFFTSALSEIDPAVEGAIQAELKREQTQIELIASENIVSKPVPLFWVYITAWATPDGVVQFREDIYNRDGLGRYAQTSAQ
jgi:hypothetical protein